MADADAFAFESRRGVRVCSSIRFVERVALEEPNNIVAADLLYISIYPDPALEKAEPPLPDGFQQITRDDLIHRFPHLLS